MSYPQVRAKEHAGQNRYSGGGEVRDEWAIKYWRNVRLKQEASFEKGSKSAEQSMWRLPGKTHCLRFGDLLTVNGEILTS